MREQVEEGWVWQSTHVGGDRFAGNLVALPDGVYYGRVEPAEAWPVVEAALAGRVHLPCYRGRSCYGFAAQAAELAVREADGAPRRRRASGFSAIRPRRRGLARARSRPRERVYEVDVRREEASRRTSPARRDSSGGRTHYVAGSPRARAS